MEDCSFCRKINKEEPCEIIWENNSILAFVPQHPAAKGHVLVIPKRHFRDIFDIDDAVLRELISAVKKVSALVVSKNGATGVNLLNASGKDAQQSVFHFHFHIVPRYPGDGLDLWLKQNL